MPTYAYTAVTTAGSTHSGTRDAPDKASLVAALRAGGLYPTKVHESAGEKKPLSLFEPKIKLNTISMFCNQMATVLRAGVPLATALDIMRDQVSDKTFKKVLEDVSRKLQIGHSLSDSFRPFADRMPQLFLHMVEAGELSGNLDMCLDRAGTTFKKTEKMNKKIRGAMAYPIVLIFLTVIITGVLVGFVVPKFAEQYESSGTELPWPTRFLLGVSAFFQNNWLAVLLGVSAAVVGFRVWVSTPKGRAAFDLFKLKLPVIGKLLNIIAAGRYTRTLSAMNAAGVSLTNALEVTARAVGNRYLQTKIEQILEDVRRGSTLSAPLERMKIFPPLITHMTRLGEESGTLDNLLAQTAEFYEDESDSALSSMVALMEPAIIIVMGVVVGFVVIAIMIPMFSATVMSAG